MRKRASVFEGYTEYIKTDILSGGGIARVLLSIGVCGHGEVVGAATITASGDKVCDILAEILPGGSGDGVVGVDDSILPIKAGSCSPVGSAISVADHLVPVGETCVLHYADRVCVQNRRCLYTDAIQCQSA